jgi:hypothetical protein
MVFTLSSIGDGLFMRRALDPTFDPEQGFKILLAVMNGILTHRIDLSGGGLPAGGPAAGPTAAAGS